MLSTDEKIEFLKHVSSFKGLTEEQFRTLADLCEEKSYTNGNYIFRQGDPGGALHIVVDGQVGMEREIQEQTDTISLTVVKPHACFGEMSLFHDAPRSISATAIMDTKTLRVDNDDFVEFASQYPELLVELNRVLCVRLIEAYDILSEVTSDHKPRELRKLYDKLDF